MRKWRVGTISMGLSLILLGIFLTVSQFKGYEAFEPLTLWWPLILVVLGIEILLYQMMSKQENSVLKYDFLSILFVGVLGTVGISLSILTSTGLLKEVQTVVGATEETLNLPPIEETLTSDIKRIIVDAGDQEVRVESTNDEQLHVFGTYRASVHSKGTSPILTTEDYSMTKIVGNTLYISLKEPSRKIGPFATYTHLSPTIVVPDQVRLEIRGGHNQIALYPGSIENHWTIDHAGEIGVHVAKNSDLKLSAISRNGMKDSDVTWDTVEETEETDENMETNNSYKGSLQIGKGTYHIDILDSEYVSVTLVDEL